MTLTIHNPGRGDFNEILSFLTDICHGRDLPPVYDPSRFQFTYTVSRIMHGITEEQWWSRSALWRDGSGTIRILLITEGEDQGEAFIISDLSEQEDPGSTFWNSVLDVAEERCAVRSEDGKKKLEIRVTPESSLITDCLLSASCEPGEWSEETLVLDLEDYGPFGSGSDTDTAAEKYSELPAGYRLVCGTGISAKIKGLCHSEAFSYRGESPYQERIVTSFETLVSMPWYRPELDLLLLAPDSSPAALMGFWYDEKNHWAYLEPAGTVPEHRRKGLGQWLIQEGCRRLIALGARRIFCVSGQDFYLSSGFKKAGVCPVWKKKEEH